jgi:hypothetical protein
MALSNSREWWWVERGLAGEIEDKELSGEMALSNSREGWWVERGLAGEIEDKEWSGEMLVMSREEWFSPFSFTVRGICIGTRFFALKRRAFW